MINTLKLLALKAAKAILAGLRHIGKFSKTVATSALGGAASIITGVCAIGDAVLDNPMYMACVGIIVTSFIIGLLISKNRTQNGSDSTIDKKVENVDTVVKHIVENLIYIIKSIAESWWMVYRALDVVDMIARKKKTLCSNRG